MPATGEDAALVVQLLRWGTELHLEDALGTLFSPDYDPDRASVNDPAVRRVLMFGEAVGTLVKQHLVDSDLVHDLWWIEGVWAKVGPAATRHRALLGEQRLYENFEALAAG